MDFMTPPMFDTSNIIVWKARMSMCLKTLGLHVFLAAIKKSYLGNSKHIEANAQALMALRSTLNEEYLSMISNCGSAFAVWNILTSPKLQLPIQMEKESSGEESDQRCFMVQGNDSLEVHSDTQLDSASSPEMILLMPRL